jgi:hypothetical protein
MSERRAVLLALSLATGILEPALAQRAPDSTALLRARLAQVNGLFTARAELRHAEEARAPRRLGRTQTEGNFTLLVSEAVPRDTVVRLAASADSILANFGGIPDSFIRTFVHVMPFVSDTAALLASPAMRGRSRLRLEWSGELPGFDLRDGWILAEPVVRAFRESRDSTWQAWLDYSYGVYWQPADAGEAAITMLTSPNYAVGNECLAGRSRSCRLWLGVDRDSQPFLVRYKPEELVSIAQQRTMRGAEGAACRAGEAATCARVFERSPWLQVRVIPAPEHLRSSLIRAVRSLHGPDAVRRALADRTGSVGERLSRAAGVSEDSLMTEWRHWVLSRGRMERVSAGAGDALTALLFTALLVGLAARSGRWR